MSLEYLIRAESKERAPKLIEAQKDIGARSKELPQVLLF